MNTALRNYRDIAESSLVSLAEEAFAAWLAERGKQIIRHNGRYWLRISPGVYSSTHPMARMSAPEATLPTDLCWGFRTSLSAADADQANGSMPLHLLTDLDSYTWEARTPRQRNKLRNFRKQVRIIEIHEPGLLVEQGYDILRSAHARNHYGKVPDRAAYQQSVEKYYAAGHGLVIGGLVEGRLGGYLSSHAVGETAYVDELYLHTQYLQTHISLGLFFEWMQICRRSISIREVVHGLHAREAPGLCRYKQELGLSVVHVPTRVWFAPVAEKIVKVLRPHAYYRLTGHD